MFAADGTLASVSPMLQPRANAACVAMADGKIVVFGGSDSKGPLASAELYDPATDQWTPAGDMAVARSGHTATTSPWGAILIVGGEKSGLVEAFMTNRTFKTIGTLAKPRTDYALAVLPTHKILIFGGATDNAPLSSVEAYDADTDTITPAGAMLTARKNFAASTLYDGTVLVTGGYDASGTPLDSTEIFDFAKGASAAGPALAEARANHQSYTLPGNGSIMLVGGSGKSGGLSSSEIYTPWTGTIASTPKMHSARSGMAASLLSRGGMLVAGGKGDGGFVSGVERYRFATVETGKLDYAPGEIASFTGSGWKSGEQVLLQVKAFPLDQHNVEFTAVTQADSSGRIATTGFNIDHSHLGAKFLLTAKGSQSQALTLFTDADATITTESLTAGTQVYGTALTVSGLVSDQTNPAANPVNIAGVNISLDGGAPVAASFNGTGQYTFTYPGSGAGSIPPGAHSIVATYTGNLTWATSQGSQPYTVTDTTAVAVTVPAVPASAFIGTTETFTATVTGANGFGPITGGTVTFNIQGTGAPSPVVISNVLVSGGSATATTALLPANSGYSITAAYTPAVSSGFSSNTSPTVTPLVIFPGDSTVGLKGNVGLSPSAPSVGQILTLTGTVTGVTGIIPTGTVNFRLDLNPAFANNILLVNGVASVSYTGITGGSHTFYVDYNSDSNYVAFTGGSAGYTNASNPLTISVATAATAVTATSTPATPVNYNGSGPVLTATVTSFVTGLPINGTARFEDPAGTGITGCTVVTVTNGVGSCTPPTALAPGLHTIKVLYTGNTNFANSDNGASPYSLTVNKDPSSVALSAAPSTINLGGSIVYTAQVSINNPGSAVFAEPLSSGTVAVKDGATTICSITTFTTLGSGLESGNCTVVYDGSTVPLGGGSHALSATYTPTLTTIATSPASSSINVTVNANTLTFGTLTTAPVTPIVYNNNGAGAPTLAVPYTLSGTLSGVTPSQPFTVYDGLNPIGTVGPGASPLSFSLPISVYQTVGTHPLSVKYPGDTNIGPASSTAISFVVNKATPTFGATITTPGGTVAYGSSQSLVANVTSAAGTPTGTITFNSGATTIGSVTLPATTLTVNLTQLPIGPHAITVAYSGDANFAAITDSTHTITIGKATVTTGSVTSTPISPVSFGAALTLNASFTPPAGGTLTGNVTFFDGATQLNATGVVIASGLANYTLTTPLTPGSHSITATYNGDANFNAFTTAIYTLSVSATTTTTTLTPSTSSPAVGATVTYNVTVTPASGGPANPTGTVAIVDAVTTTQLCTFTLIAANAGSGSCPVTYNGTPVETNPGAHTVKATFTSNVATSWSNSVSSIASINVGVTASSISTPTSVPGPSYAYANTATFSAIVSPHPGSPAFTGTVQFFDGGTAIGAPIVPNAATGMVTSAAILLAGGNHTITAQFSGDSNYGASPVSPNYVVTVTKPAVTFTAPGAFSATYGGILAGGSFTINPAAGGSTPTGTVSIAVAGNAFAATLPVTGGVFSPAGAQLPTSLGPVGAGTTITFSYSGDSNYAATQATGTVTVTKATPTITLVSNQNPSNLGQSVTFTATVASPTTGATTGTVTFSDNGVPIISGVALSGGVATYTTSALTVATHPITATVSTDTNFNANTSAGLSQVVNATATGITLTPSTNNPSLNSSVTYSVTLTGGTTPPQGSVTIVDSVGPTTVCTIAVLTVGASSSTGNCVVNYDGSANRGLGGHSITAVYAPLDARWTAMTSAVSTVTVVSASTTISTPASTNGSSYAYGQTTTLSAQVSPASPIPAYGGLVKFYDGGTLIGSVTPAASGLATLPAATLLAGGPHTITAQFAGDANYGASAVSANLSITVNKVAPTFTLTGSTFSATYGGTLSAGTLAVNAVGTGVTPTGTVTLASGASTFAGSFPLAGGVATVTSAQLPTSLSPVTSGTLTFNYSGDANYAATPTSGLITVTAALPAVSLVSSQNPSALNQSVTFTASIATQTTGTPTGSFTFKDNGVTLQAGVAISGGQATYTTTALTVTPPNSHSITAVYSGDTNFATNSSAALTQTVNAGSTTISLTPSSTTPKINDVVTYSVTITGGLTPPQGSVANAVIVNDGATQVCSIPGSGLTVGASSTTGSCTVTYNGTSPNGFGSHSMTAVFSPLNGNWSAATSAAVTVTVGKGTPLISNITVTWTAGVTNTCTLPTVCVPYGTKFGLSVTMTPAAPPAPYLAGINFVDNNVTNLGGGQIAINGSGVAAIPATPGFLLSGGTHTIKASFPGDANWNSVDPPVTIIVGPMTGSSFIAAGGTFAINTNPINTTYGGAIPQAPQGPITVTLVPPAGLATPTGTVTLSVGAVTIGTFNLNAGVATISVTQLQAALTANAAGLPQTLVITYNANGDTNYSSGTAPGANQINIAKATPVFNLNVSPNPSNLNQNVAFVVTASYPVGQPTGTVNILDNAVVIGTAPTILLANGTGTYNTASLTVGTHPITAAYIGDANFNAFTTTPAVPLVVTPGNTTITFAASNQNPSLNSTVTYSFTVTGGSTPPQGTVSITDAVNPPGTSQPVVGCTTIALTATPAPPLNTSSGTCTVTYNNLDAPRGAGVHPLTAIFTPTVTTPPSWSAVTSSVLTVTVGKAATSVSVPTVTPSPVTYGTNVTVSTIVTPNVAAPAYAPSTVQFFDGGVALGGPVSVTPVTGVASFTTVTPLLAGNHSITAQFIGDANYSTSPISATLSLTVGQPGPALTIPVGGPTYTVSYGGTLTTGQIIVAKVGAGVPPTGTVTVSTLLSGAIAVPIGNCTLTASAGNGVCTFSGILPGSINVGVGLPLTFTYNGDSNYAAGPTTFNPGLTVTAAIDSAVVTSSPLSPVPYGQTVSFTVTLSGPGNPANGTINFTSQTGVTVTNMCTGAVVTNNVATCSVTATTANSLAAGSHTISVSGFVEAPNANHTLAPANTTAIVTFVVGPPVPLIVITSNVNPSAYGQAVTFTATVSGPAGAAAPVGQLQFFDGNGTVGPLVQIATSAANVVTYTLTVPSGSLPILTGGTHAISATYIPLTPAPGNLPDPNYSQGSSQTQNPPGVLQQVVTRAPSQTVNNGASVPLVSTVNITPTGGSVYGQAVTFSADVLPTGTNTGIPTGIVIFKDGGVQIGTVATLQSVGLIQRATLVGFTGLTRATHGITAEYQGDTNFSPSLTTSTLYIVDYDPTKTTLGALPAAPTFGGNVTFTAQVCGLAAGLTTCGGPFATPPNSTITFLDGTTVLGTGQVDSNGNASISVNLLSLPLSNPPVASHNVTARYDGHGSPAGDDPRFLQSTSAVGVLGVGKGVTSSAVVSSVNPSVTGQSITFTATVSAPGSFGPPPTGPIAFFDGPTQLGTATLSVNGGISSATLTVPSGSIAALAIGQHVISVQYGPDPLGNYSPSNSPLSSPNALVQTVNKAPTTTTLQSSNNASNVGQQITLTATVTVNSPGSGTPTGSVQFINSNAPTQPTVIGTSPLIAAAGPGGSNLFTATLNLATLPQGNPILIATYSGDNSYLTSTSTQLTQAVQKTPTNIQLTTSLSPAILGQQVTFAITISPVPPGTGTPTGQIQIYDGTALLATATLQGGQYQYITSSLLVGQHAIGVAYLGDTNFQPFTSPTISQVVSKIPTSLNMTSNAITAIASQVITFTAVLSPNPVPGVPFAQGQVGFYDGATLMGVSNLQSNVAALNVSNLAVGLHQVSAIYLGDDNWSGATSGFFAQTISLASTGTTIVTSTNPSVYGQPVTYTIAVTVPFPGTVPAQGQVQLFDNNVPLGDPLSANNGVFTSTIPNFAPGTHTLIAKFLANSSFSGSQSATLLQVVNKAPTVTTLAALPNGSTSKQQVTMTAVVVIPLPGGGIPTGSVQFANTTFNKVLGNSPIQFIGGVYTATLVTDQLNQSGSPQVLVATYSGDVNFASSSSNPLGQSVFGTQIAVVNGAGNTSSNFAADSWATIYGDNLANTQLTAVTTPYPTSLAGTTVTLTDSRGTQLLAPLYFVSPGQVNFLIPSNIAFGLATLTVTNPNGATASTIILITRTSPGLFSANASGQGVAAALIQRVRADSSQSIENVAVFDSNAKVYVPSPIVIGADSLYLQLYGTGIRYVPTLSKVTCTIGGINAQVLYASAAPGFSGLDQVNVVVPGSLAGAGTVNVVITVDGQTSNVVTLNFGQ